MLNQASLSRQLNRTNHSCHLSSCKVSHHGTCCVCSHTMSPSLAPFTYMLSTSIHVVFTHATSFPSSGARALLDISSTPDMRDVDELVVTAVAPNWQKVALSLGVEGRVSQVVFDNHPNDHEGACRNMFDCWLRGEQHTGEEERTWSTLLTAVNRAGYDTLALDLQREHFKPE